MNIKVPEQVSVIGFDDINFCGSFKIPLTTIRVPAYKIGETAATLLIKQINKPSVLLKKKKILQTKLIKRDSCTEVRHKNLFIK